MSVDAFGSFSTAQVISVDAPSVTNDDGHCGWISPNTALINCLGVTSAVSFESRTQTEIKSSIVRVSAFVTLEIFIFVIGYRDKSCVDGAVEVRDAGSLEVVSTSSLGLKDGERIVAHAVISSDCVWVLRVGKKSQRHFIVSLKLDDRGAVSIKDVPVPLERFPTALAALGQGRVVWGISNEAFCVWNSSGSFVSSFDPSVASRKVSLGAYHKIAPAGTEHAVVSCTHGVTVWNVMSRTMIHHRSWPCVQLFPLSSGLMLAVCGSKLRVLALQQKVDDDYMVQYLGAGYADNRFEREAK